MGTGQKSSDGEVSESVILSRKEIISQIKMSKWPYLFIEECLYSMCETIIYLITVRIAEESGEFGGNFHNCHESYLSWTCAP